ncbi:MAG: FIST C-terminal domain-containing protein [Minwuia sp.]|uniref:FIST signal transduction protein n=1 Tax=Minwuia sp. TaxID=2493630 RepID=UPI003A89B985
MSADGTTFAYGYGADRDWRNAAAACLDMLDENLPPEGVGFIYLSDYFAPVARDILTVLRGRTGIDHWVGAAGIGISAGRQQIFDTPALAAMVAGWPRDRFAVLDGPDAAPPAFDPWFGILHGNPQTPDLPEAIADFADRIGGYWVGGLAASRGPHPMIARGISDAAVSGVVLSPEIEVATSLSQGCTPIGPEHEITKAEDNVIIELDGRNAFEVFAEEIGDILARNLNRVPGFIFAGLPVAGADTADYLVRDIVGLDPQYGAVGIGAEAVVGSRIMFCRRDGATATEDMGAMLERLEKRLGGKTPKAGLYYSCLGRGPNMFEDSRTELDMIAERFGDLPLTGFFCNGEISNARLYTYTGVLSLFL